MKTWTYEAKGEIKAKSKNEAAEKLHELYDDFIDSCVIIKEKG